MSISKPIKVAILWHMHQPDYRDPYSGVSVAPWVRLRAAKDYLDMLLLATEQENVRVTFNLVPSLLEQFEFYRKGGRDFHFELTALDPANLNDNKKHEILSHCFKCHPDTMIYPYSRYNDLFRKWQDSETKKQGLDFSAKDIRDAQLWSNLTWVDPLFRTEPLIKSLFEKGENYSENDKQSLLNWQIAHIGKIIPAYQKASKENKIDISFSPYFHPILPLLCDSESAKESLPEITLPEQRFNHPEDARRQIEMSQKLFQTTFGRPLQGMWPSEGSVSEEVARLCSESGLNWIASDEQVLYHSLKKSGLDTKSIHPYSVFEHSSGIKLFFRDHNLSDKIGFVYSSWDPQKAADDFIVQIKNISKQIESDQENSVIPIILDGENAWEYYQNDGLEFLRALYRNLSTDPEIETVTMSQAAESLTPRPLKSIFAGSWINHNFRIWIGHEEDNTGWVYLKNARNFLTDFEKRYPRFEPEAITAAWRQIYIAEGSDWFWWYGDEHRGPDNYIFDNLFRGHLAKVYELLDEIPPRELRLPIITQIYKPAIQLPDALVTPTIDGRLSHFYEWFGSGVYHCEAGGGAMHRTAWLLSTIHFGFDHEKFYLRLDFKNPAEISGLNNPRLILKLNHTHPKELELNLGSVPCKTEKTGQFTAVMEENLEVAISRKFLWTDGFGKLALSVELYENGDLIEIWPEKDFISLELPEKNKEIFWLQ